MFIRKWGEKKTQSISSKYGGFRMVFKLVRKILSEQIICMELLLFSLICLHARNFTTRCPAHLLTAEL